MLARLVPSVLAVGIPWGRARLAKEDRGEHRVKIICDSQAYAVPERVEGSQGRRVGCQEIGTVSGDGHLEASGYPVREEGAGAGTRGGEPFHKREEGSGQGLRLRKVLLGVAGGQEPEDQPPHHLCLVENEASEGDGWPRGGSVVGWGCASG